MASSPIEQWHTLLKEKNLERLELLLDDTCVFHSPVLHAPQNGKTLTLMYLTAAFNVLVNDSFHYVREIVDKRDAVLEFVTIIEGITINGVDMIKWNDSGKIVDFKVLVRPVKGLQMVQQKMAAMLKTMTPSAKL